MIIFHKNIFFFLILRRKIFIKKKFVKKEEKWNFGENEKWRNIYLKNNYGIEEILINKILFLIEKMINN